MKFYVNDSVDRWTVLDNDVTLYSKEGKEKTIKKDEPAKEVYLFYVEIECDLEPQEDINDEMIINNIVKSLFVLYGEKCLDKNFFLEQCKKHFSVMRIKNVNITQLDRFYKSTTIFRGKETAYSSSITNLALENVDNV